MIVLAIGRRELGKTTLALYLASRVSLAIVLDPRALVPAGPDGPVRDLPDDEAEFWRRVDDPVVSRVVVQPDDLDGTSGRLALLVRDFVEQAPTRAIAVVLDEAGLIDLRPWYSLIRCGPRDRLTIVLTAHRPQDLPTVVRALADDWALFRTTQPHDLDAIEDRCGAVTRAAVIRLKPKEFVLWDDARGTMLLYRDPAMWYVPLDRADCAAPESLLSGGAPAYDRFEGMT